MTEHEGIWSSNHPSSLSSLTVLIFAVFKSYSVTFEFFRIEFYRIYIICRICRRLTLVILKIKTTNDSILQILMTL